MEVKDAATSIFSGQTGCGKTHLVLNLLESSTKAILTISQLSAQPYAGTRPTSLDPGSEVIQVSFSSNQETSCSNGSEYCWNYSQVTQHYSS